MEGRKICKDCRWYTLGFADRREGQCYRPKGKSQMQSKEQVERTPSKVVHGRQDASNCPNYEYIDRRNEKEFMRRIKI